METFPKEPQEQVMDLYRIMSLWTLLRICLCGFANSRTDYTFKPGNSPKQLWCSFWTLSVPRQTCDGSLSTEALSCLRFAWLWRLSSGCRSSEMRAALSDFSPGLPHSRTCASLLWWTGAAILACPWDLVSFSLKLFIKQSTLPRPLFHFLSG